MVSDVSQQTISGLILLVSSTSYTLLITLAGCLTHTTAKHRKGDVFSLFKVLVGVFWSRLKRLQVTIIIYFQGNTFHDVFYVQNGKISLQIPIFPRNVTI